MSANLDQIPALQAEVDALDARVVELLRERLALSRQIGSIKRHQAAVPFDQNRIGTRHARFLQLCHEAGFPGPMAEGLFTLIANQVASDWQLLFDARPPAAPVT